ncbi:MAG: tetratricopeptide repeat protein [Planctomycetota bacterium]|jgi:tetratricopeptide (TPR) repeat protein|nr:tetratricopeptide repeat protein [Planctomycetota bacterium]MEC7719222.1 tetratricopeptide repeat protein [Planctomycetota bacterium]MEC8431667.1 tetratricopeptide repeat protein [Planctomycetota bacterium]MEC8590207.1 tetratricopeptide repeat protein [Planctomycetota bacterium]MEC8783636.1 tetratricopeptide repeat protein [Planctomycetota bacterium]
MMIGDDNIQLDTALLELMADRGLRSLEALDEVFSIQAEVFHLRGQLLRASKRYGDAIAWLQRSIDLDSKNLEAYLGLGWCYKRLGQVDLAIEALEHALDIPDETGIVQYNLACYWALVSHIKLAVEYLARALEIDPHYRSMLASEPDFDTIRNQPDFLALTAITA